MYWVPDRTGRFDRRPHYRPDEIDAECEALVTAFLLKHRGCVAYPLTSDDLTVLVETRTASLDLYADLKAEGEDVEGVTEFRRGTKPDVSVSASLTEDARRENRLRTTLTHELGHVHFHDALFQERLSSQDLFVVAKPERVVSYRDRMLEAPERDWLEWQACYASGSILMPKTAVRDIVVDYRRRNPCQAIVSGTAAAADLIAKVVSAFGTSRDAARVRLSKLGHLVDRQAPGLFD